MLVLALFLGFGTYHLGQFETTDEHFWKYERIPAYWEALAHGNVKKTAINDKPGVSVALTSGIGLFFVDPNNHRVRDNAVTRDDALTVYDASLTEPLNRALRLPLLGLNALLMVAIYWLLKKAFPASSVPLITVTILALTPALVGISQIINPDALLWSFGFTSVAAVLAFLQTAQWRFVAAAAISLGFALLSKYTANVLFPLFFGLLVAYPWWCSEWRQPFQSLQNYLKRSVVAFTAITFGAALIFALGMPAVFVKPEKLWDGIFGFWQAMHLLWPLSIALALLAWEAWVRRGRSFEKGIAFFQRSLRHCLPFLLWPPLLFFGSILILAWWQPSWLPLNDLLVNAKENGDLTFARLNHWPQLTIIPTQLLVAAYPFVVSNHPLLWCVIGAIWFWHSRKNIITTRPLFFTVFLAWFMIAYTGAALAAGVLTNVRYSILLFPLFALIIAISIEALLGSMPSHARSRVQWGALVIILCSLTFSLAHSKPFYLNYATALVPQAFAPHDAWGYGQYEAAQFLNALPENNILIWSDRNGICQFLIGPRCISGYRIDVRQTRPDYFIISKRGRERGYVPRDRVTGEVLFDHKTVMAHAIWRLNILERPDNFILIAPSGLPQR